MLAELLSLRRRSFKKGHYGNSKKVQGAPVVLQLDRWSLIPCLKWNLLVLAAEELSHLCIHGAAFAHFCGGASRPGALTKHAVTSASPWTRWCSALAEHSEQRQLQSSERHIWKVQKSSMRIKQWKEGNNPLRKLASIVWVGVHIERKKWGLFSQAVGICGRDHSSEGQLEEWRTRELFVNGSEAEDILTAGLTGICKRLSHRFAWQIHTFGTRARLFLPVQSSAFHAIYL